MPSRLPLDPALTALAALPGACPMPLRQGQVLVYAGHLPPGVFVALQGVIEFSGARSGSVTAPPAVVVPALAQLSERSSVTITVSGDGQALYFPRTLVAAEATVREKLTTLPSAPTLR